MSETTYRGRRAVSVENERIRVTMLVEGGHIAELLHKSSGVNPLWTPPWPSIEPSSFDPAKHTATYGAHAESKLLSGLMGHNLCMDIFGGPSPEETAAGMTPHGEASIAAYELGEVNGTLTAKASFPMAQLAFTRTIRTAGNVAIIEEEVENIAPLDKPTAWTQHATLGAPFVERGKTALRASATKSRVYEADFAGEFGFMQPGADFHWPHAPLKNGGTRDLRQYTSAAASGGLTTHLMDPAREQAFVLAWHPDTKVLCGYVWQRADFPWLAIWEENHGRKVAPWNGDTLTWGLEFGVNPMPEPRRQMIERGSMFGVPGYRWIPAKSKAVVRYCAFVTNAAAIPEQVTWDGEAGLTFG
ncbi:MAG: hypothetical protein JNL98_29440 [Bryobacterales bacterium]|nr:hypothetical protein [Bryobacterales bacterium]